MYRKSCHMVVLALTTFFIYRSYSMSSSLALGEGLLSVSCDPEQSGAVRETAKSPWSCLSQVWEKSQLTSSPPQPFPSVGHSRNGWAFTCHTARIRQHVRPLTFVDNREPPIIPAALGQCCPGEASQQRNSVTVSASLLRDFLF